MGGLGSRQKATEQKATPVNKYEIFTLYYVIYVPFSVIGADYTCIYVFSHQIHGSNNNKENKNE